MDGRHFTHQNASQQGIPLFSFFLGSVILALVIVGGWFFFVAEKISYGQDEVVTNDVMSTDTYIHGEEGGEGDERENIDQEILPQISQHIETPPYVRALYITSWIAGRKDLRHRVVDIVNDSSVNAVVIDIKDDTGKISFAVNDPYLQSLGSSETRIRDLDEFIDELHEQDIYVIGRISVFQDTFLAPKIKHEAVQRSDGSVWRDRKGLAWFDVGSPTVRKYVTALALESYERGFDEIQLDYVRFPSDGNMSDIVFPLTGNQSRSDALEDFFIEVSDTLRFEHNIPVSADIFGMTTSNYDDLGIGQVLEKIAPHVDYIAPMSYPSHYPSGWNNIADPASEPYRVIRKAAEDGIARLEAIGEPKEKLRFWLQDFDLGATYTTERVVDQMQALDDVGLNSWMMWDPANTYTVSAYAHIPLADDEFIKITSQTNETEI